MLAVLVGLGVACGRSHRVLPDTEREELVACLAFVNTVCNKLFYECTGAESVANPCAPSTESECPNRYFSPGSNVSVSDLQSCAARWRDASCDDLRAGARPDCLPDGDLDAGEACVFGSECSSGYCASTTNPDGSAGCGECQPVVGELAECQGLGVHCAEGLECRGTCQPIQPFGLTPGSACQELRQCQEGYYCLTLEGDAAPSCQPAPAIGERCPLDPLYCAGNCDDDGLCVGVPGYGEPCALTANAARVCEDGLRCDLHAPDVPTCTALLAPGDACKPLNADFSSGGCEAGTLCHCDDLACETGTCVVRRNLDEPCGGEHEVCIAGTSCVGGICASSGPQERFSLACSR